MKYQMSTLLTEWKRVNRFSVENTHIKGGKSVGRDKGKLIQLKLSQET